MNIRIRRYRDEDPDDTEATARIFFDAVHLGATAHYDAAQRNAWAPEIPETPAWRARLKPQTVLVAERGGAIVGFMTLTRDGRIDLAYVAPDMIGRGVAKRLYDAILAEALEAGLKKLTAHASRQARPFFERQGWRAVRRRTVTRNGVALTNFAMERILA
ncbi:MAG: GNAT family N-acetyltransferase [Rhodospirillales bacterium]